MNRKLALWLFLLLIIAFALLLASCDEEHVHTPFAPVRQNEVLPTCISEGSFDEVIYCHKCREELSRKTTVTEKLTEHTKKDKTVENEILPTCTADGSYDEVFYCVYCDFEMERVHKVSEAVGHSEKTDEKRVEPTCEADGIYGKKVFCSVCEEILREESTVLDKKEHTESEWITVKEANCTAEGEKCIKCTDCQELLKTEKIEINDSHLSVTIPAVAPTLTNSGLTEGQYCKRCEKVLQEQKIIPAGLGKTDVFSASLEVADEKIKGSVSNSTEIFSFLKDITVHSESEYIIARDVMCENLVISKNVTLEVGDNIFYLFVSSGKDSKLYTVEIRRLPTYTVTFDTNGGGSLDPVTVEEGSIIASPTVEKAGYILSGWDFDFSSPITSDITAKASWAPRTDTVYTVKYYLENVKKNGYELFEEISLAGVTDSEVFAEIKEYAHFKFNEDASVVSGMIMADGTLALTLKYTRDSYSAVNRNTAFGSISGVGSYPYGEKVSLFAKAYPGYRFLGWFMGGECISTHPEYTVTLTGELSGRFEMLPEMNDFIFTSDRENCVITGVKNKNAQSITLPDCVTEISENAFAGCSALIKITLGKNLTGIGVGAFSDCKKLVEVYNRSILPIRIGDENYGMVSRYALNIYTSSIGASKLSEIDGGFVFYSGNGISYLVGYVGLDTEVILPDSFDGGIYEVYNYAFSNNSFITSITLPEGVRAIGEGAFFGCYKLVEVYNRSNIEIEPRSELNGYVAYYALNVYTGENGEKKTFVDADGFLFYDDGGERFLIGYLGREKNITLPNPSECGEYKIYKFAFADCGFVESMTLYFVGESRSSSENSHFGYIFGAESADENDFFVPKSLKKITLLGSSRIYANSFSGLSGVREIVIGGEVEAISRSAFYASLGLETLVIGDSVKSIAQSAFRNCTSLKKVTFGESLISIERYAFNGCSSLLEVTLSDSVREIGDNAFSDCLSLYSFNTGSGLTSIGGSAFLGCINLSVLTLGSSVSEIGDNAFFECFKLVEICNLSDIWLDYGSESYGQAAKYARNIYSAYSGEKKTVLDDDGFIYYVDGSALYLIGYTKIEKNITLPELAFGREYEIYRYALAGRDYIESLTLPFVGASKGSAVNTHFGYIFGASSYIRNENSIPKSLKTVIVNGGPIDNYAFYNCIGIEHIKLYGETEIGSMAFYGCKTILSVTLGENVSNIGDYAFIGCYRLVEVFNLSKFNITPGSDDFGMVGAYAIKIYNYESDEYKTFTDNDGFVVYEDENSCCLLGVMFDSANIILPSDFNGKSYAIYKNAFFGMTSLVSVTLSDGVTEIGEAAFYSCTALERIYLSSAVASIGESAFFGCAALVSVYYNGDEGTFKNIDISSGNNNLKNANIYYTKN